MSESFSEQRSRLVEALIRGGVVRSPRVKEAMLAVPREEFVWPDIRYAAYYDSPQPLGKTGQTISAPHMVAIMLEELDVKPGMNVLEIGAGSGYNAALLAELVAQTGTVSEKGHVTAVDRIEELVEFASENLRRTGYSDRFSLHLADGTLGYPERSVEELYDRIVVTAAAPRTPRYLTSQLKKNGLLLIPLGDLLVQSLTKVFKDSSGKIATRHVCECMFVPLIGKDGYGWT